MLTEEQKENRKKGIGASEAAIVMGLNKYISPYQLWLIKTGQAEPEDISDLPQVYWGNMHEDNIATHYAKLTNCEVKRVPETLYHKDYQFILCHLDREVVGQRKILECKFAMFARDEWGTSDSDIVPIHYIIQVQHQLAVTGYEEADLAVLIGGWDYRIYHFKRDEKIIEKIIEELSIFWKCVEDKVPPPLRDRTDVQLAYPFNNDKIIEAEPEIVKAIEEFREVRAQSKQLDEKKEKLTNIITMHIKEYEGLRNDSEVLATFKATARGNRVLKISEARI